MFQGEFNKDMFNHEFQKYKQEQKQKTGFKIVRYDEPETRISMRGQDSIVTLGQGKISNFSGETGTGLNFTDYKAPFTTDSTLIDESMVSLDGRSTSVKGLEQQRSNISYQMSAEDRERQAYQEALQNKEESLEFNDYKYMIKKVKTCITKFIKCYLDNLFFLCRSTSISTTSTSIASIRFRFSSTSRSNEVPLILSRIHNPWTWRRY